MKVLIMAVILGLVIPFIVAGIKKLWSKLTPKVYPLLPFGVGVVMGILALIFGLGPKTINEALLLGVASGGVAVTYYDIWKALVPGEKTPEKK